MAYPMLHDTDDIYMYHGTTDPNLELHANPREQRDVLRVSQNLLPFREPTTSEYYNNFFCPNLCHVCKKGDNGNMTTCDQCNMVLYCSTEHKMLHYGEHRQYFCQAIKRYLEEDAQWRSRRFTQNEWIHSRKIFLYSVQQQLPCELKPYEKQMILFAKSCFICHQQANLQTCQRCYSYNYCDEHAMFDVFHTREKCKNLMISINLDIGHCDKYLIMTSIKNNLEKAQYVDLFTSYFGDFSALFEKNVCFLTREWVFDNYIYTDFLSGVLSLFDAMERAGIISRIGNKYDLCYNYIHDNINEILYNDNSTDDSNTDDSDTDDTDDNEIETDIIKDTLVFHIITGTDVDKECLPTWEILIHILQSLKHIIIVLIGQDIKNERNDIETCISCKTYNKTISYEGHCMLYHNYVNSEFYKQPDMIVGFQAELYHEDIAPEFLIALRDQRCPLFLTTTSLYKMEQNERKMHECLGLEIFGLHGIYIHNKFSSRRPWKDLETNDIYYRNSYMMIYKRLHDL